MDLITLVLTGFHSYTHSFLNKKAIVTAVLAGVKDKTELLEKHLADGE